jgi:hypothetical protein
MISYISEKLIVSHGYYGKTSNQTEETERWILY